MRSLHPAQHGPGNARERGNGKIEQWPGLNAAGRCQKEPGRLSRPQILGGYRPCDVGSWTCFFLASYSEPAESWPMPPTVAGPLAGRLRSGKGRRRGSTKRLGAIQGHLAWSEVLHKGQPDCEGWQAGSADKVRSAGIMSCLSQTEKYRRGATVLHQAPLCHSDGSCATWVGRVATPSPDDSHLPRSSGLCAERVSAYRDAQSRFWGHQGALRRVPSIR